ncbi:MAG TPA: RDD family protein [Candidatus Dormibacteraeota bacterium]|nr:RDD family protein [Candidatus Dormibacteraeota bacterium]
MPSVTPDGEMVVATPERVAFNYALAGVGSRFLAQAIDVLILTALYLIVMFGIFGIIGLTTSATLAVLIWTVLLNILIFGYFLTCEAVSSGQTPGKRALKLRAVGDGGEPLSFSQAATRNLVRLADFMPLLYAVGIITLFANGRGKRLGDLAAGTVVVRERARLSLRQLVYMSEASLARAPYIAQTMPVAAAVYQPRLDPQLRDFVVAYRTRRDTLAPHRRAELAERARAGLAQAMPDVVAHEGPLAALDRLADSL